VRPRIYRSVVPIDVATSERRAREQVGTVDQNSQLITQDSSPEAKIELFRSLFRGRTDVFPVRFESEPEGQVIRQLAQTRALSSTSAAGSPCRLLWNGRVPGTAATSGSSLKMPSQPAWRANWVHMFSPRRWSVVRRLVSVLMIGFFRIRILCPKEGLEI
jgi:hypothetical protein